MTTKRMTSSRSHACSGAPVRAPRCPPFGAGRMVKGSAAIEFILIAPLLLTWVAFVWDLRQFIGIRTALAREMFVVAEIIANETNSDPIAMAMQQAMAGLANDSAGSVEVAVVVRGTQGSCASPDDWCLPAVRLRWPGNPADGQWNGGGDCAGRPNRLPAAGDHFGANDPVLPNEDPDVSADNWTSRHIRPREWWVVIHSCIHPSPGLLGGVLAGFVVDTLDITEFVFERTAAWPSIHELPDCDWC